MGLPNIAGTTGNPFGGWVGFFPPSSCMSFSPKVISVTRCTPHGAASDATFIDAKVSLIAVFNPKPDEFDDPSPFFLGFRGFFLVLTGRAHINSSSDAAFGVSGCSYVSSFDSAMVPAFGHRVS